ncbi:MAG: glycosyltransferase [Candidatus Aenigmarchaeota archaeon]|nr:glycosyltransferase [Candidatus Aenigmarchaeota archaeon]
MPEMKKIIALASSPEMGCGIGTYAAEFYGSLPHAEVKYITHSRNCFGHDVDYNGRKDVYPLIDKNADWTERACDITREEKPDVVSVQHEFGLYRPAVKYETNEATDDKEKCTLNPDLLKFLSMTKGHVPIQTTFHTIYSKPMPEELLFIDGALDIVDIAMFHCRYQKEAIAKLLGDKKVERVHIVPHGARDDINYNKEACKAKFGYDGKLAIGQISWFADNKGWPETIEAYEKMLEKIKDGKNTVLVLGGGYRDPNYAGKYEEVRKRMKDSPHSRQIIFLDDVRPVRGNDIYEALSSLDIAAGLYKHESQSGFFARACACGLPGVYTDMEGFGEQVRDGDVGILVKPLQIDDKNWATIDTDAAADAMALLVQNDALREEKARNTKRYVAEQIGWTRIGSQVYDIFKSISEHPHAVPQTHQLMS